MIHSTLNGRPDCTNINTCVSFVKKYNIEPLVIFDLGARDGRQSIDFSTTFPDAKIYSFEPNPNTIELCRANLTSYKNIQIFNKAVNLYNGVCKFYPIDKEKSKNSWDDGNQGASSLFKLGDAYRNFANEEIYCYETSVECTRLDSFLKENSIENIDILWMDIQGAERIALQSLSEFLKNVKFINAELETFSLYENLPDENKFANIDELLINNNFERQYGNPNAIGWDDYGYINLNYKNE